MAKIKVYLDNCAYNRPFDDQTQIKVALETEAKRHIQRLIAEQTIDLVYSYVNRFENDKNPHSANRKSINEFFKKAVFYIDHAHSHNVEIRANAIRQSGIKTADAFHLSCAIEGACNYFITTDKPLLKYRDSGIIICNPTLFFDYMEEQKDA
jgi:predicted nucleic acid-binding protein